MYHIYRQRVLNLLVFSLIACAPTDHYPQKLNYETEQQMIENCVKAIARYSLYTEQTFKFNKAYAADVCLEIFYEYQKQKEANNV